MIRGGVLFPSHAFIRVVRPPTRFRFNILTRPRNSLSQTANVIALLPLSLYANVAVLSVFLFCCFSFFFPPFLSFFILPPAGDWDLGKNERPNEKSIVGNRRLKFSLKREREKIEISEGKVERATLTKGESHRLVYRFIIQ